MSWNKVEKASQKKKQKQNVIIDNEDLEGLGNDSIFTALSNIDNKEQKKNDENANANKEMKQSSSNSSLNSPKTPKKIQNTSVKEKTTPIEDLSKLNVSNFISKNISINNNEQDQIDQLKKLCNYIETEITNKLYCSTTKFSNKSFDIDSPEFKGPINYLAPKQRKEIENVFLKCNEPAIKKLFTLISKCIFVGEKKAVSTQKLISNTIAHQICVQIISNLYPGILYKPGKEGKTVYDQIIGHSKDSIEKLPAIGNTLIWICNQQHHKVNKKEVSCPEYITLWMDYFLNALASADASIAIKTQSVKLLNKVLDDVKENKSKIDKKVKIPLDSFIAFVAIIKTKNIVSQMKKYDKLYNGVTKAYDSLKSLLFDSSSDIIQFNVSNVNMFNKLYNLLSDPKYDKDVYNEFLNIVVLTFGKEKALLDTWSSIYKQFQPSNITRSNDIVKEIKNQQTEYLKSKKYCPENNCWEEIDNDRLRNTLYTIIGKNEEYRSKNTESEINEMNKNIRTILDKTTRSRDSDGGFFDGFFMKLIKRSIILVLLISLSLHILDSVDNYTASKNTPNHIELPPGHPPVKMNADITKCPYHSFRNKYTKCNQCHPIIKYVYDFMDEPYKYVESRVVIPAYENVWKPYCSKIFMKSIQYGYIPAYRYVKPIMREKVIQPVQENVIPRVAEVYDTYAKEYVDKANKNIFKPALSTSGKYLKQAYVVLKPATIKAKDCVINDVVKPSLPYLNKARVRAIQYGNQFLDVLAEIPYKRLMKNGASNTLRFIGYTENSMERLYDASTPYVQKYWNVLSRKTDALMKQDSVQKIITNPYVKTTTGAIRDTYHIWSDGVKVTYVYLTKRGPETGGSRNWKDATDKVSIKKDIRHSIDSTKRFFKGLIERLDREEINENNDIKSEKSRTVKVVQGNPHGTTLPTKKGPKLAQNLKEKRDSEKKGTKIVHKNNDEPSESETKKIVMKDAKAKEQAKEETKKVVMKDAKAKEKVKEETKKIVMKDAKAKKEHVQEKNKEKIKEKTKQIVMEDAKVKEHAKEETKKVMKKKVDSAAKQLAKEKAKIKQEVKRIVKEDFENNVSKQKDSSKNIAKAKVEATKEIVKEKANDNTKQVVKEHAENTKKLAKESAVKQIIKEEAESSKHEVKKDTKPLTKGKKEDTKQIIKEQVESTKQLVKEKANTDTKQIVKEHYETTKQLAKEQA